MTRVPPSPRLPDGGPLIEPVDVAIGPAAAGAAGAATERNNLRAMLWLLLSVVASSAMTVAVRGLSDTIDSRMIVLLRAGATLALILMALPLLPGIRARLRVTRPGLHLLRGLLIGLSTHLGFYTLSVLPLATATVLFFTAPIFATLLAMPVHGERVGPVRLSAVAAGFLGAVVILRPGVDGLDPCMIAALGSSVLFAGALTLSRGVAAVDGAVSAFASSVLVTFLLSVPLAWGVYDLPGTSLAWLVLAILVIAGGMRGYADIRAYQMGEAAVLAPVAFLRLVVVAAAGFIFFGEVPDGPTLVGAAIIVTATLVITHRESRAGRRKAKTPD
ncbi:DMT family transporter [Oceanomicrobium pacificus]|uniref:EamA family transporter n=1 Tax=Oceanomicrobium pacificus TaxID=2692916 RepID=A0A6B0TSK9_9RHOB|nr:DMT family transporter [Oceanomicrobium pacificus]MXU64192.1 EamA family transporter [Oceanomicrobium pacificus]